MWLEGASDFEAYALWVTLIVAVSGLLYALYLIRFVLNKDKGTEEMQKVSLAIQTGAEAYLKKQLRTVFYVSTVVSIALFFTASLAGENMIISVGRMLAFVMGATFSASVGYIGMSMAVRANVRVAQAARSSFSEALKIGYRTGTVTGMLTDGLGLLGGTLIFMIYDIQAPVVLLGFGFGGTLIALFMRVGGGIYTKAADVGADLVGKVEKGIPEDDPRNAAVIADLVGDNVGDCAGMAADIFESYEVTMVAAMILGLTAFDLLGRAFGASDADIRSWQYLAVVYPLLVRAIGVVSSMIGTYSVKTKKGDDDAMKGITKGYMTSTVISFVGFLTLAFLWVNTYQMTDAQGIIHTYGLKFFLATLSGIILALAINHLTEYFTSDKYRPVQQIGEATETGAATVILSGMASGLESSVWSIMAIAGAMISSTIIFWGESPFMIAYGVALTGIGMLTLTGNTVSMDSFGPIVDNANGVGEIAQLEPQARQYLADLDAVGNTTKAITKGIAIGSAVIAATSLFVAFVADSFVQGSSLLQIDTTTGHVVSGIEISNPLIFSALLIGASIPFLFSSIAIRAVNRAAELIVIEVRRQFRQIKGLWEGEAEPDYETPVKICTTAAQKELVGLATISIVSPILIGMLFGEVALGAFMGGSIVAAQLLAVYMSNAGGAWDNAKKHVEDGYHGGKGSEQHKASVVGDTVGDPLKDTAGPALNPMVKVINLMSVIMGPIVVKYSLLTGLNVGNVIAVIIMIALMAWAIWYGKKEIGHMVENEEKA